MNESRIKKDKRFMVVSEGGTPIYSYPKIEENKENLFSFLFSALTSLGDAIWGTGTPIKLEKGGKYLIAEREGNIFFSFLMEKEVKSLEKGKIERDLTRAQNEFIERFGNDADKLIIMQKDDKENFSQWLEKEILQHDRIGEKIGYVVKETQTKQFTLKVEKQQKIHFNQLLICRDRVDNRKILVRVGKIEKGEKEEFAICKTLREIRNNALKPVNRPVSYNSPVFIPNKEVLTKLFNDIPEKRRLYLGNLMNVNPPVPVYYNVKDLSTHFFIVASTGGGKSYTLGVLIEELLKYSKREEDTALLIFDFHNEFGGLTVANQNRDQVQNLKSRNLSPQAFSSDLLVFNWEWNPIKLRPTFSLDRLKFLSNMPEEYALYLQNVIEDSNPPIPLQALEKKIKSSDMHYARKRAIESRIQGLQSSGLFSKNYFTVKDIIQPGKGTLIQLGNSDLGDWAVRFVVADLLRDLYQAKLNGEIPSNVILFLDEAHKFAPRASDDPLSSILHAISREGRKLGLWLVISTQTSKDLSEVVMKNCNSLLALSSPKRQTKVISRIYGVERDKIDVLSEISPGKGFFKAPSFPFPLMVDVRPRQSSEISQGDGTKAKVQKKIKEIATRTKEHLSSSQLEEKVKNYISNHKRFTLEEIAEHFSVSIDKIEKNLSKFREQLVKSSENHLYSAWYWNRVLEEAKRWLREKGVTSLQETSSKFKLPKPDTKILVEELNVEWLDDETFCHSGKLENYREKIKKIVEKEGKIRASHLLPRLGLQQGEFSLLLTDLNEHIILGSSETLYSKTFWQKKKETLSKIFEKNIHFSHTDLVKKIEIPPEDLRTMLKELPVTHIRKKDHWYWKPKLEELKERVTSSVRENNHITVNQIKNKFHIPLSDINSLTGDIKTEKETIVEKMVSKIKEMPHAAKHFLKLLLENDGRIMTTQASSTVNSQTLSYLEKIDLISYKNIGGEKFVLLRLDQFLRNYFGVTPNQQLVNHIAYRLLKEI